MTVFQGCLAEAPLEEADKARGVREAYGAAGLANARTALKHSLGDGKPLALKIGARGRAEMRSEESVEGARADEVLLAYRLY